MSIKNDIQYKYFINWLNFRLQEGTLNKGQYELMKISESSFSEYCFRYNNQIKFKESQDKLYKSINRDSKIQDIINGSNSEF